jgi:hypothetical protein
MGARKPVAAEARKAERSAAAVEAAKAMTFDQCVAHSWKRKTVAGETPSTGCNGATRWRDAAMAHDIGGAVERVYLRSDLSERRRKLMTDWAAFCKMPQAGKVVPLRSASVAAATAAWNYWRNWRNRGRPPELFHEWTRFSQSDGVDRNRR